MPQDNLERTLGLLLERSEQTLETVRGFQKDLSQTREQVAAHQSQLDDLRANQSTRHRDGVLAIIAAIQMVWTGILTWRSYG